MGDERERSDDETNRLLATWLGEQVDAEVAVEAQDRPEGVGHSNETWLIDATWDAGDGPRTEHLVFRVAPGGLGVFPDYDLTRQALCLQAVGEHSTVPVPTVRWEEPTGGVIGRPFYVMDRIEGVVPADRMPYTMGGWLKEASPEDQATLWWSTLEVLADLHRIDVTAAGLDVLHDPTTGRPGVAALLAGWERYGAWALEDREHPTFEAVTTWLHDHLPRPRGPVGLAWGDARISNVMYRDFRPVAVFDWEMADLGPGEVDLGWMVFFQRFFSEGMGIDDLPGFPEAAATVDRYAELAGRDLDDLWWYEVFAAWRHTAIMGRIAVVYEQTGEYPVEPDTYRNNIASRLLAKMLDLPDTGPPGPMG